MTILCQIHKQYDKGWQYSTSIFVGVNSLAVVVIATSYGAMFVNITRTRKRTPDSAVDVTLAKRFFVIVFTNLLCWLPVITVKLVSFLPVNISGEWVIHLSQAQVNQSINQTVGWLINHSINHYCMKKLNWSIDLSSICFFIHKTTLFSTVNVKWYKHPPPLSTQ